MATFVDQGYHGWPHEEVTHQDDPQEVSAAQMLDHGSISFGRYACESLSWEKRSVFTYNKCQEELEKFKSPGLVAKKKAYFEEYYKRIRAMKALQESQQTVLTLDYGGDGSISSQTGEDEETARQIENPANGEANAAVVQSAAAPVQQTELSLDYGGDGSICSQTGEDDEAAAQFENPGDEAREVLTDVIAAHPGEVSVEVVEEDIENSESIHVHIRQSDTELLISDTDSMRNNCKELEENDEPTYPHKMQNVGREIPVHELLTTSVEKPMQLDFSNLRAEASSRETSNSVTNSELKVTSKSTSYPTNSGSKDLELKSDQKVVPRKVISTFRKCNDRISSPMLKKPSTPTRNGLKLEGKSKLNISTPLPEVKCSTQKTALKSRNGFLSCKSSAYKVRENCKSPIGGSHTPLIEGKSNSKVVKPLRELKYPNPRTVLNSGNGVGSCKATADKIPLNNKSLSVSSHRSLTEVQSNVTIPRPFSLSTDRRAVVPSESREGAQRTVAKPSNQQRPSTRNGMNHAQIQGNLPRTPGANGVKSKGLEVERCHEERKKSLTLRNQAASFKPQGSNIQVPVMARSIDLAPHKLSANSGSSIKSQDGVKEVKIIKRQEEPKMREIRVADTTRVISSTAAVRSETKKMVLTWKNGTPAPSGSRQRFGEQSLDGKKPMQEKPRWR